jgi:hypothetical protein
MSVIGSYKDDKIAHMYQLISDLKKQQKLITRELEERQRLPDIPPDAGESPITFDGEPTNSLNLIDNAQLTDQLNLNLDILTSSM